MGGKKIREVDYSLIWLNVEMFALTIETSLGTLKELFVALKGRKILGI